MNAIKEQIGVFVLVFVLLVLLGFLWLFRADHDVVLSMDNWIAGVLGALFNLITGKVATSINNSKVTTSVENT